MEIETLERPTKQSNARKYGFMVLLVLLIMALIALTYLLKNTFFTRSNPVSDKMTPACDTEICNYTAQRYSLNMDPTVDPCENFYQFACGGFIKNIPIPPEKNKISVSDELEHTIQNQLKQLLTNLSSQQLSLPRPYSNLVQLYKICMNQEMKSNEGIQEARKTFQEAGGWPLLDKNSLPDDWTFQKTEQNLKKAGLEGNGLLKTSIETDSTGIHFAVEKPKLILPESLLTKGSDFPEVKAYQQYMIDVAVLYGAEREEATQITKRILDFEISLAAILTSRKDNEFSSMYTVSDLKNLPSMKWIDWADLLMVLLPETIILMDTNIVIIKDFEYIDVLNEFLKKKEKTDIVNYMFWRAAESLGPLVSEELRARKFQSSTTAKEGVMLPRWRHCLDLMASHLDITLSSLYVKHFVNLHTKLQAEIITENIRQEMIQGIQQTSGIDEEVKKAVTERIKQIVVHIAYPQQLTDMRKLEAYYHNLTINNRNFLREILDVRKWKQGITIFQAFENNTFKWTKFAAVTSPQATFSAKDRSIVLNAGFLQPPVFSPTLPLYINYGSVGYLIGHHLTHVQEDRPSNVGNTTVNSIVYKGALKLAFGAYQRQQKQLARPALLPGLEQYSAGQLLMISMANTLCTKHSQLVGDKTQTEIRVNTVAKSSPEFSQVFKCAKL